MSQHKHWMCWRHTRTKWHNNRPIMSWAAVQWHRQRRGEERVGGREETKMSERACKWLSEIVSECVFWLHAEGQSCTSCALFRSHFTWPERMLSNQQALQRYSINTHVFTFTRSKVPVKHTHACKRNIWTDACQQVHMHMLKKINKYIKKNIWTLPWIHTLQDYFPWATNLAALPAEDLVSHTYTLIMLTYSPHISAGG